MGRITASVTIENTRDEYRSLRVDALVDTGASYVVLPVAWRERLGRFESEERVPIQTADQKIIEGVLCGPARIQIEGFRAVYNEVLFLEMQPLEGEYEPLIGYLALEQSGIAVDMLGHRLIPVRYMDLK